VNAREQAHQVRKEAEFLDACAPLQDALAEAKDAVRAARKTGNADALAGATARLETAKTEINEFRNWARTMGKPRDLGPGSAIVKLGS
jgi:hypothetical protein